MHVGDTRAYEIVVGGITQLTQDQTFVRREVEAGRLTPEEAIVHPRRNVLLQCLGSTKEVVPDLVHGNITRDAIYLLCSDGFRHVLTEGELRKRLGPAALTDSLWHVERMRPGFTQADDAALAREEQGGFPQGSVSEQLAITAQLVMDRKEQDNLTAVVMRVKQGDR